MTVAPERSVSNRSAFVNVTLSPTPSCAALRRDNSTMSGLYSMPNALAPRLAAVMTVRPSPEPRSMTVSCGVTFAKSSMRSTRACAVGTQMTSLPSCPTVGVNSFRFFCGWFLYGWWFSDRLGERAGRCRQG